MKLPSNVTANAEKLALAKRIAEERDRAKRDKMYLATEVLGYDFQPDVHQELFDQLIPFDASKPWEEQSEKKRRLILWPRSHYKSTAMVVEIIQAILNFPDARLLLMRGSVGTTKTLFREVASHFTGQAHGSRLKELFWEYCGSKKELQLTETSFITPARVQKQLAQATLTVASPNAIKTGEHYTAIFADDLIHEKNYRAEAQLEKAREQFYMALPLLDNPACYVYVTGTRYAFGDLYELIIRGDSEKKDKEWVISVKNCWSDDGTDVRFPRRTIFKRDGTKKVIGTTREELLAYQQADRVMFASQYLNKPASTANQLFDEERMKATLISPNEAPPLGSALFFVDLANGKHEKRDDAVIIVAKVDQLGRMYVVDGAGGKWSTLQLLEHLIAMSLKHRPLMVFLERSGAGLAFVELSRPLLQLRNLYLPLDFLKSDTQADAKYIRISALDGYFRLGRLFFFNSLPIWPQMLEQFIRWTGSSKDAHDDYPDTVALMAQYFAQNAPVMMPSTPERHPLLEAIEQQQANKGWLRRQQELSTYDGMGDDFTC